MANSKRALILLACASGFSARPATAQQTLQQTQGFAVERFHPSASGGGWFVMDDLNFGGYVSGAISLNGGYARKPFEVTGPGVSQKLAFVSGESFIDGGPNGKEFLFGFSAGADYQWTSFLASRQSTPIPVDKPASKGL